MCREEGVEENQKKNSSGRNKGVTNINDCLKRGAVLGENRIKL